MNLDIRMAKRSSIDQECLDVSGRKIAEAQFNREWKRQAKQGKTDSFGSAEYRRVKSDWISAGRPTGAIEAFIRSGVFLR